jgi:hypothetical protein
MSVEVASGLAPNVALTESSSRKADYLRRGDGDDNFTRWEGDLG